MSYSSAESPQRSHRRDALRESSARIARLPANPMRSIPARPQLFSRSNSTRQSSRSNAVFPESACSTTCSFSSGSSEQVEYTSVPPAATCRMAARRIATWRLLQVGQILGLQSPFDFRIVRQSAGAGAGHVGQHAIEARTRRLNSSTSELTTSTFAGRNQFPQQPGTVGMQFQGNDVGLRISFRQHARLAAGRRTTIENSRSRAHQQCDQLRGLVLDRDSTFSEGARARNISRPNPARGCQQLAGSELDSIVS